MKNFRIQINNNGIHPNKKVCDITNKTYKIDYQDSSNSEKRRILGYDVARTFAILGMMLVNYSIVFNQGVIRYTILNKFISIFEGRAAAIFLILAGIGIGKMTESAYLRNDIELRNRNIKTLIKRSVFLFALGLFLYSFFGWTADILHYYGIYMIAILFFIYKDKAIIFSTSIIILIVAFCLQISLNYMEAWDISMTNYDDFWSFGGFIRNTFYNGYHPFFPWFSFMLTGLGLSRFNLFDLRKKVHLATISIIVAIGVELFSHTIITLTNSNEVIIYLFDTKPMNPSITYIIASTAWAVSFILLCVIIEERFRENKVYISLANCGQMALTHYVLHALFVLGIFELIDGLSQRDELFVILLSLITFVAMIIFSYEWKKRFSRGPLETIMRRFSN